jgi:imidazoleglycerol phosphate synthase glutamine amidotransferase subunit HisH
MTEMDKSEPRRSMTFPELKICVQSKRKEEGEIFSQEMGLNCLQLPVVSFTASSHRIPMFGRNSIQHLQSENSLFNFQIRTVKIG